MGMIDLDPNLKDNLGSLFIKSDMQCRKDINTKTKRM